jgi:CRISPR/Cas system CSM-associated protein Csm2 small subunit
MKKRCERCGKEFEAREAHYKFCPNCFLPSQQGEAPNISGLLLKGYYDQKGNRLKEVYIDVPQRLANAFFQSRPQLAIKQLRDIHNKILKARTKALLKGIDSTRSLLYECQRDLEYQVKRNVVPETFAQFMKHHLALAEKDEKSLDGFFQHLDSIVCYFPVKK